MSNKIIRITNYLHSRLKVVSAHLHLPLGQVAVLLLRHAVAVKARTVYPFPLDAEKGYAALSVRAEEFDQATAAFVPVASAVTGTMRYSPSRLLVFAASCLADGDHDTLRRYLPKVEMLAPADEPLTLTLRQRERIAVLAKAWDMTPAAAHQMIVSTSPCMNVRTWATPAQLAEAAAKALQAAP